MYTIGKIEEGDLDRLTLLEKLIYPPEMVFGREQFHLIFTQGQAQELCLSISYEETIVAYLITARFRDRRFGDHFYITDIAVHPDHQRQGLGKQLISALLTAADRGLPIAADCRIGSYNLLIKHPELLARLKYHIQSNRHMPNHFPNGEDGWKLVLVSEE